MRNIIFVFSFFLTVSISIFSQTTVGKIITAGEADSLFGNPSTAVTLNSLQLSEYIKASSYLYFSLKETRLIITNNKKEVLYPEDFELKGDEIFHVYSSSVIDELLGKNNDNDILVEMRKEVMTITNGDFTLEFGMLCPPYCDNE